YYCARPYD
nr:immunoglobulin heavy chain junction region [Mus musculus]